MTQEKSSIPVLVFEDSSKEMLITSLGLKKNSQGDKLIDTNELTQIGQDLEIIHPNNFGGVLKGSKIMIKKDVVDIVRYFKDKSN